MSKCKVQREKRNWCVLRMERSPVVKKQRVEGEVSQKRAPPFPFFLSNWSGATEPGSLRRPRHLVPQLSPLLLSGALGSGWGGGRIPGFPECFTVEKLRPGIIYNKIVNGFSFFLFS